VQDVWNAMPLAMSIKKISNIPLILYTMPDSPNIKWIYGLSLALYDAVLCPTHFAARELCAAVQAGVDKIDIPRHDKHDAIVLQDSGVGNLVIRTDRLLEYQNLACYYVIRVGATPIPRDYPLCEKSYHNIPVDREIILNVNTNSFRKRLDLTLLAFKYYLKKKKDAILVIHAQGGQQSGWDIKQLCSLFGIEKSVIYSTKILTESELFGLYSCANLMINTSSGEGWGLPALEGYSVGVNQIVPDYSATQEIWTPDSRVATLARGFHYSNVNTLHGQVCIDDLVTRMVRQYPCGLLINTYTWTQIAEKFDNVIYHVLNNQTAPEELSLHDITKDREPVTSLALELLEEI